jgi:hypothetical protein
VSSKQGEKKDKLIEQLSLRYDSEYCKFEDRVQAAVAEKDRQIEEMRGVLEKQKVYGDELEREMNQLSNECLT